MEYFVFNKEENTLGLRESFTHSFERVKMKVISFEIRDGYYYFELDKGNSLGYKAIHLPIQNTIIARI